MRLDRANITIRPRTAPEILDLAFVICRRWLPGLALMAFIGCAPFIALNHYLFRNTEFVDFYEDYQLWPLVLLTIFERPWATAWITLYLGQICFEERFSFRRAIRDWFRALWGMIVYQVIIRALCVAIVVLIPFLPFMFRYMNEIILLERPKFNRIWTRRTAINARNLENIFRQLAVDWLFLTFGWFVLSCLAGLLRRAWDPNLDWTWLSLIVGSERTHPDLLDHACWWIAISFFAVVRFVAYIDGRIRREGWDVELKFRHEAAKFKEELAW